MKTLKVIFLFLVLSLVFTSCVDPFPDPPWEPWNEIVHRDTLSQYDYFIFQLEATTNWDTIYFTQEPSYGFCEILVSDDSASYYQLFYYPEYFYSEQDTNAMQDTIEVELYREIGIMNKGGPPEYMNHFFYFTILP